MVGVIALVSGCSGPKAPWNYILDGQIQKRHEQGTDALYGTANFGGFSFEFGFRNAQAKLDCLGGADPQFQEEDQRQFRLWDPKTRKPIDHRLDTWHAVVVCKGGNTGKIVMTRQNDNWVGQGNLGNQKIEFRLIYDDRQFLVQ